MSIGMCFMIEYALENACKGANFRNTLVKSLPGLVAYSHLGKYPTFMLLIKHAY